MAEELHDRVQLAQEQLDVAIELFLSGRSFVSALTLAGACEEILGKALAIQGQVTTLQHEHTVIAPLEEFWGCQPFAWKDFINEKNRVRNAAKHMEGQDQRTVVADLQDEAVRMLVRACDNHSRLGQPKSSRMDEFDQWFYSKIAGEPE